MSRVQLTEMVPRPSVVVALVSGEESRVDSNLWQKSIPLTSSCTVVRDLLGRGAYRAVAGWVAYRVYTYASLVSFRSSRTQVLAIGENRVRAFLLAKRTRDIPRTARGNHGQYV